MAVIRGLMSPRRSSQSRRNQKTAAPPNPTTSGFERRSSSSGIRLPKPNLKIATSRLQTDQQPPNNPNRTTSFRRSTSNFKVSGFNFTKHVDSPYASPNQESGSSRNKAPRILFKIYKEIASHRQGNSSITSYFTKLKVLWDQLAKAYDNLAPQYSSDAIEMLSEHMEREKVIQFLVGLNDSYSSTCSKILLMRPFPTVDMVFSEIIRKENRT